MWISWLTRMKMKNLKNLTMYHLAKNTDFNNKEIIVLKGFGN